MRAEIKRVHSPDVDDVTQPQLADPSDFGVLLQFMLGPQGEVGEETFDLFVCTPSYLGRRASSEGAVPLGHSLVVPTYDWSVIRDFVTTTIAKADGATWRDVASLLSTWLDWEFAGYRP